MPRELKVFVMPVPRTERTEAAPPNCTLPDKLFCVKIALSPAWIEPSERMPAAPTDSSSDPSAVDLPTQNTPLESSRIYSVEPPTPPVKKICLLLVDIVRPPTPVA